jgi:hypothetical protein
MIYILCGIVCVLQNSHGELILEFMFTCSIQLKVLYIKLWTTAHGRGFGGLGVSALASRVQTWPKPSDF